MSDNVFYSNGVKVLGPVPAVFPHLQTPDNRFGEPGDYKIGVDVTPEIEARIKGEVEALIAEAHAKYGVTDQPSNQQMKKGVNKRDEPFHRIEFKMKAARKSKGKEVPVRPQVVDAQKRPLTEDVFSGSTVYIAYELQYSITGFGCNVTPKLKAVQVTSLVGADGVNVDSVFDTFDGGFTSEGSDEVAAAPAPAAVPQPEGAVAAGDF